MHVPTESKQSSTRVVTSTRLAVVALLTLTIAIAWSLHRSSAQAAPLAAAATDTAFVPLVPARLLDTRNHPGGTIDGDFQGVGRLAAGSTLQLDVTGRAGVPADAGAVILNLTAVDPTGPGYLTAWPCGEPQPATSNVNYVDGQFVANTALANVGADGQVCVVSHADTDLVIDVSGYVPADGAINTLTPSRLHDTRDVGDRLTAGSTLELTVTDRAGVPADAKAVMVNVTAIDPAGAGYVTVWPCGTDQPGTSNLNHVDGQTTANAVLAGIGSDGRVCLNSHAATDLAVDVFGYVPDDAPIDMVAPARLLDTRTDGATIDGQFLGATQTADGSVLQLDVAGRADVPDDATAVVLNLTAIDPAGPGYVTIWPCDTAQPVASNLNYLTEPLVTNAVFAKIGIDSQICVASRAPADLVIDISAFTTVDIPPPPTTTTTTTTVPPTSTTTTTTTPPTSTTTTPPTSTTTTPPTSTTTTTTTLPPVPGCVLFGTLGSYVVPDGTTLSTIDVEDLSGNPVTVAYAALEGWYSPDCRGDERPRATFFFPEDDYDYSGIVLDEFYPDNCSCGAGGDYTIEGLGAGWVVMLDR